MLVALHAEQQREVLLEVPAAIDAVIRVAIPQVAIIPIGQTNTLRLDFLKVPWL